LDTSAFIRMHRLYPNQIRPDLWLLLSDLLESKRILSHQIVYEEIVPDKGEMDELAQWINNYRDNFLPLSQRQIELLPDILKNFPKLIDYDSEKNQADPWLIAMVLELMKKDDLFKDQYSYIIVTTENVRSSKKIPAACKHYNIEHMNLFEFFNANNFIP